MARRPHTPPLPLLHVIPQRHSSDCAIACLAMFLGVRYEDVLVAVGKSVIDHGMTVKEVKDTAAKLKTPLQLRRHIDLDTDTGILGIQMPERRGHVRQDHVVILHAGLVFDTDGTVWEVDDYLQATHAKAVSLLVRKE